MRIFAPLAIAGFLAAPAAAQDMTDAERDAFRAEVRAYLLENPEVLMEAIDILESRQAVAAQQRDIELVQTYADSLFNSDTSYVGGNPDGDITVVEFLDYRCGYCKRAHAEVAELINRDSDIRYVIKELPILGEQSELAARYALAVQAVAGDEAYFAVHNTLMEFDGNISEPILARVSTSNDLDHDDIVVEMSSPAVAAVLYENRLLAQNLSISGTPSFVFADQMVRGYVTLAQMEEIVAEARTDG